MSILRLLLSPMGQRKGAGLISDAVMENETRVVERLIGILYRPQTKKKLNSHLSNAVEKKESCSKVIKWWIC